MSYKNIAVAVEENDGLKLLNKSIELATTFNSSLTIIHVNDNYYELYNSILESPANEVINKIDIDSELKIHEILNDLNNLPVKILIKHGSVQEVIRSLINEHNIDLLVCGHHHSFLRNIIPTCSEFIKKLNIDVIVIPV